MRVDELRTAQRAFLAGLATPLAGDDRARAGLAVATSSTDAAVDVAVAALLPSPSLSAEACFGIYHRQYWLRLLDSLREDYPATVWLLGDAAAAGLFEAFLAAHPPRDRTLRTLGAALPAFVAAARAPAHVVELIALEAAWLHAFAAGAGVPVAASELARARLDLAPHLTLLTATTPSDRLWRAARDGQRRPRRRDLAPARRPRHLLVVRGDDGRRVERLHPAAHALLAGIAATGSLVDGLAAAAPHLPSRGDALVRRWFAAWCRAGWLVARERA